jgi:TnpA family transposase
VPLNGYLIGAHEYEAHHVFDIWYRNTSDIVPTAITGDMHSVNKANFAILHWFGLRFEPRFTDLDDQLQELYCADDLALYEKCLIRPAGQIDRQLIVGEKANIDRIVATLGLKEMTQGTLIRKLCTYTRRTRRGAQSSSSTSSSAASTRCATCAIRNWSATFTARRTALSPITSYARPSPRSAARRN